MKEFRDRVAVVTGAASGIGRALAERFSAEGMKVVLADVEEKALLATRDELEGQGATVLAVHADVAVASDVRALGERTLARFGRVDVVCNNAGVLGGGRPVWELADEDWQWVLGVNLWGVIHGIQTFVPILLEQGTEGHIVNMASMAGLVSLPLVAPYHATKHAVVTISESLHFELRLHAAAIDVSVVCPEFVKTRISESDRNRPADLTGSSTISDNEQLVRERLDQLVAAGIPPEEVAARVVEAVRERRFYVFSHPEALENFRVRSSTILNGGEPVILVPEVPDLPGT